jgi:hypothetical protein
MRDLPEDMRKILGITEQDVDHVNARVEREARYRGGDSASPYDAMGADINQLDDDQYWAHQQYLENTVGTRPRPQRGEKGEEAVSNPSPHIAEDIEPVF